VCVCLCVCVCGGGGGGGVGVVCMCVCVAGGEGGGCGVCVCGRVLHIYIRINKNLFQNLKKKIGFMTFVFCFVKLSPVTFHPLRYQLVTIILHKISICHELQHSKNNLLTDTFTATV